MHIDFYEKPGCINNTKQKHVLLEHGHTITVHSILTEPWSARSLRQFFVDLPIERWFNMAAPAIKNGELNPRSFNEETAIAAMIKNPILIRRPLISAGEYKACGFDHKLVARLIKNEEISSLLTCKNSKGNCD